MTEIKICVGVNLLYKVRLCVVCVCVCFKVKMNQVQSHVKCKCVVHDQSS